MPSDSLPVSSTPAFSRGRKVLFTLLALVLLALPIGLLLTELTMRVLGIVPLRFSNCTYIIPEILDSPDTNEYGRRPSRWGVRAGEFAPGTRMKKIYPSNPRGYFDQDSGVLVAMNQLGLRGPEVQTKKPDNTYRILGIGDSFTFGEGVRDEDTFLRRLESLLNARFAGKRKFEVLNAGVGGYDIGDEVLCLEKQWIKLEPDLVLITFYINDAYSETIVHDLGDQAILLSTPCPGLSQYSYFWDYVTYSIGAVKNNGIFAKRYYSRYFQEPSNFLDSPGDFAKHICWPNSYKGLVRAKELSVEREFKLGLIIFPDLYDLKSHPFDNVYRYVQSVCEQLEVPCLDLMNSFRGRDAASLWVHPIDHHPNEIAHSIAAEAIEPFVIDVIGLESR